MQSIEELFVKQKIIIIIIMKENVAHKRSRGSSSSSFDTKRCVKADVEAQFHDSIKKRVRLKEMGFEIDSTYMSHYEAVFNSKGWQIFCKQPKVGQGWSIANSMQTPLTHKVPW